MKFYNNIDLLKNEIQNFRVQNLVAAPSNPVAGQHYFNTVDNTEYVFDGTKWINALSQGDYTFTDGVSEENRTVFLTPATNVSIGGVIVGTNIDVNNGTISVKDATNAQKGLIQLATDLDASSGVDETKAINSKQLAQKVTKNEDITGATKTKITYDSKGLVTAGSDLTESDIPNLHLTKITDVTATKDEINELHQAGAVTADFTKLHDITVTAAQINAIANVDAEDLAKLADITATAAEINVLDGITATTAQLNKTSNLDNCDGTDLTKLHNITVSAADLNKINDKLELDSLSAVSPITYDNTTGEISATFDNTPTENSNNLIKSGAVKDALDTKIDLTEKGAANGVATLDANGLVPSTQLPSYVDDVIELKSITTEPSSATAGDKYYNSTSKKILTYNDNTWGEASDPETGKIYVFNDMAYRWSGTNLVQIGADKLKGFNGSIEGDGTTTVFTINHSLGTRNIVCEIYDATTYDKVYVNLIHNTTNSVQAIFSQAPAVGTNFLITIIAIN